MDFVFLDVNLFDGLAGLRLAAFGFPVLRLTGLEIVGLGLVGLWAWTAWTRISWTLSSWM